MSFLPSRQISLVYSVTPRLESALWVTWRIWSRSGSFEDSASAWNSYFMGPILGHAGGPKSNLSVNLNYSTIVMFLLLYHPDVKCQGCSRRGYGCQLKFTIFVRNHILQRLCRTLTWPALFLCAITFNAVATIGFGIVSSGVGNNVSPTKYMYPEHVTEICFNSTYSFGSNLDSFLPPRQISLVYSVTLWQESGLRVTWRISSRSGRFEDCASASIFEFMAPILGDAGDLKSNFFGNLMFFKVVICFLVCHSVAKCYWCFCRG